MSYTTKNSRLILVLGLFACSYFSFGQIKLNDSTWLPIYVKDTTNVQYQNSNVSYDALFYKSIYVPSCDRVSEQYDLKPIAKDLSELLEQTGLNKSYQVSEIKDTELENSLRKVEQMSFPFASCITSKLAEQLEIQTNKPSITVFNDKLQILSEKNVRVLTTKEALDKLYESSSTQLNYSLYVRHQLLNFIIGNTNQSYKNYSWIKGTSVEKETIEPYIDTYENQYMSFDGTYKLIAKLIKSYQHIQPYDSTIKNIKKASQKFIGFDVNMLSHLPFDVWQEEMEFIQKTLNNSVLETIQNELPKGVKSRKTEVLFDVLKERIANIKAIGTSYYNLMSPHKVVVATNANNLIEIHKTSNGVSIKIYNEKEGKQSPIKDYQFSLENTKEIWVYGLKGNDYFEVSGKSKQHIPIKLIGGENSDKYELINGKKVMIYDDKQQTFIVQKDKAKSKLSDEEYITTYSVNKYKHTTNKIKPKFGANPDDGLFLGVVDEYKLFGFDQHPYSQLHQLSANFYLGTQGFNIAYYGEQTNVFKGFSVFGGLAYQSPNYSTNFFGFGNETPNYDDNLKLDYNRVRMEQSDVMIGVLKHHKNYELSTSLFFESRQIDDTPDRFVSSATLFFPEDNFFERKNYVGISGAYKYTSLSLTFVDELIIQPKFEFKVSADINEFSNTNSLVKPSLYLAYPFLNDKINLDVDVIYQHVFGNNVPFYQAANIGGSSGLRGYRNQRFTGQSSCVMSTDLKWFIKDLESEILPLQFGVLGGLDAGRVWLENDNSSKLHTDFGAGLWLQTADLIKAQLQVFKGDEDVRLSFNLTIGI